jgi:hypothetical protein
VMEYCAGGNSIKKSTISISLSLPFPPSLFIHNSFTNTHNKSYNLFQFSHHLKEIVFHFLLLNIFSFSFSLSLSLNSVDLFVLCVLMMMMMIMIIIIIIIIIIITQHRKFGQIVI